MVLAAFFDGQCTKSNQACFDNRMKHVPSHQSHTLLIRNSSEDNEFSTILTISDLDKKTKFYRLN
ncbi:MAG: hypothetical protein CMK43_06670 [Porticoccaceae bacterium]|nr:hypothetical protein [Porticoccaceae bacterium]